MEASPLVEKKDYHKKSLLGEGSYGRIYLVKHIPSGKDFALKEIECKSLREANRVKDEPFKLCQVHHQSIVTCYGFYFHETKIKSIKVGIIMEYVKYPNLGEVLNKKFRSREYWKESDLIEIAHNMIKVLAYMQREGIAHRDLKPENIFSLPANQIKLTDMGESKMPIHDEEFATIRGTPRYLSPILVVARQNKQRNVTHNIYKSDVFSLGLIMIEMASLLNITDLNNFSKGGESKTKNRIKQLKVLYTKNLLSLLETLLTYDEAKRPDFIEMEKIYGLSPVSTSGSVDRMNNATSMSEYTTESIRTMDTERRMMTRSPMSRNKVMPYEVVGETSVDLSASSPGNSFLMKSTTNLNHHDSTTASFVAEGGRHRIRHQETSSRGSRKYIHPSSGQPQLAQKNQPPQLRQNRQKKGSCQGKCMNNSKSCVIF